MFQKHFHLYPRVLDRLSISKSLDALTITILVMGIARSKLIISDLTKPIHHEFYTPSIPLDAENSLLRKKV